MKVSDSIKIKYESYEDLPITPVLKAGVSILTETSWLLHGRPEVDKAKCTGCKLCWLYCPEGVVRMKDGKPSIDYAHCKGCGICANECPVKAITMAR
ncbi:MAG: 4Fe-4S binding protein [Candidatus Nezhaarchaeales archaeon]